MITLTFIQKEIYPNYFPRKVLKLLLADVNGDGLDDVYIAGATAEQVGQLYLQQNNGSFIKKRVPDFEKFADFEDVAVLFFDADKDGDLDLFVGCRRKQSPI